MEAEVGQCLQEASKDPFFLALIWTFFSEVMTG